MSFTKGPDVAFDFSRIKQTLENIKNLRLHRLYTIVSNGTGNCPLFEFLISRTVGKKY